MRATHGPVSRPAPVVIDRAKAGTGRPPGTKLPYMAGYTEKAFEQHGKLDADAELLQKPFGRAALARAVRRVLDSRSS